MEAKEATLAAMPQIEIPDERRHPRFSVLSYEQVRRLNELMSEVICIHGRGNFPTVEVKLCDLVAVVRAQLEKDGVHVKEVRLNGSGASSVLAPEDSEPIPYNDLDLIFAVDLNSGAAFETVKCAVLDALLQLLPESVSRRRMSSVSMREPYVSKMVKVNEVDRWSLITLGNNRSKSVELKFVDRMKRQYEFSVDSFHILLDTLFLFYDCAKMGISEGFYPTVVGESMYGDFREAIFHLSRKLIATKSPEQIRGGGLLKYCNLLTKGYQSAWPEEVKSMERYMCSRFFIDFPDVRQQQAKLENYLTNHFQTQEDRHKYTYLMILYNVVDESTVCLMGHERRLTLGLIEELALNVYKAADPSQQAQMYYHFESSYSVDDGISSCCSTAPSLASPMSDACSTISSADSTCSSSSGYLTPPKPETPGPQQQMTTTTVITTTALPPPAALMQQPPPPLPTASAAAPVVTTPSSLIPTYEIVTSCQPAVVYSNGYYYTSFAAPPPVVAMPAPAAVVVSASSAVCSCSHPQQQQQQWPALMHHEPVMVSAYNKRQQQQPHSKSSRHHKSSHSSNLNVRAAPAISSSR